jgi:hypothetical protein
VPWSVHSYIGTDMSRFAILEHDWPSLHWDFFLEAGSSLRAWRLLAEPGTGREVPAEPNATHRLLYLDYEGPVAGGRGIVRRWDAGTFDWIVDEPERIVVELHGQRVSGSCQIVGECCRFSQ